MTQRRLALGELPDWPRYLSLREAAAYLGVSPDLFAREVRLGVWPPARARAARLTWDRKLLDRYADANSGLHDERWQKPSGTPEQIPGDISDEEFNRRIRSLSPTGAPQAEQNYWLQRIDATSAKAKRRGKPTH